jgi:predicted adenine nucleotide alpha hydrolase (AANH) superfamily ATPase
MYQIAKREGFYKQEYCGCVYSMRDTNKWRTQNGRERIKIGIEHYQDKQ